MRGGGRRKEGGKELGEGGGETTRGESGFRMSWRKRCGPKEADKTTFSLFGCHCCDIGILVLLLALKSLRNI